MKTLDYIYDYYKMTDEERFDILKEVIVEDGKRVNTCKYFPIFMSKTGACQNYGEQFGLLSLMTIVPGFCLLTGQFFISPLSNQEFYIPNIDEDKYKQEELNKKNKKKNRNKSFKEKQ